MGHVLICWWLGVRIFDDEDSGKTNLMERSIRCERIDDARIK